LLHLLYQTLFGSSISTSEINKKLFDYKAVERNRLGNKKEKIREKKISILAFGKIIA
jgi:hypothetical protein